MLCTHEPTAWPNWCRYASFHLQPQVLSTTLSEDLLYVTSFL